jgi:hypothetical protein
VPLSSDLVVALCITLYSIDGTVSETVREAASTILFIERI